MARSMVISLIGRPNVGKSTIYNRIMKNQMSCITHDLPGVTRDRHYGMATLNEDLNEKEIDVILVDTGGFYPEKVEVDEKVKRKNNYEPFFNIMADHAKLAIDESDLVLFVVDVREGLLPFDKAICDYIRTTKKKMWLLVNKFDSDKQWGEEADFYALGMQEENFYIVSGEHGRGMSDLRRDLQTEALYFENQITEELNVQKGVKPNYDVVGSVAIIGAPNVGKSTLLNRLIGARRALVSNIAGTTVDPIEGYIDLDFGKYTQDLSILSNQFRKDNTSLIESYKQYMIELEEKEKESGLISIDEEDDLKELVEDIELLESLNLMDDIYYGDESDEDSEEVEEAQMSEEINEEETDLFDQEKIMQSIDEQMEADSQEEEVESEFTQDDIDKQKAIEEFNSTIRSIKLVDTAGIRRSKLVKGYIETQSVYRSLKAISESDVVIYMVDATKGILHQDRRLIDIALDKGKSVVVALNKMDELKEIMSDSRKKREWLLDLRAHVPWLEFCELITISAKKGSHVKKLLDSVKRTLLIRHQKVSTGKLNELVSFLVDRHPIHVAKGGNKPFKVKYASMIKSSPPTFLMFSNRSKGIPVNYRRYLSKGIRKEFNLVNTPVHLIFRTRSEIAKRIRKSKI